jgi:hypothetical protein
MRPSKRLDRISQLGEGRPSPRTPSQAPPTQKAESVWHEAK